MKSKHFNRFLALCAPLALLSFSSASAAQKTWAASTNTTWNTTTANWSGVTFTNGDDAIFSSVATNAAITLGANVIVGNIYSNGANTPALLTITGAANLDITLGTGVAGTGNISDVAGTGTSHAQNITYNANATGSNILTLAAGSGTSVTPTIWNMASGKTFLVTAGALNQLIEFNNNTVRLTGLGVAKLQGGAKIQNGTFNLENGILSLAGSGNRATNVTNTVNVNVSSGAILDVSANSGTGSIFAQNTTLASGATLRGSAGAAQHVTNSGTVAVTGTANIVTNAPAATNFIISGAISDGTSAGSLNFSLSNVANVGVTILSGANTYTGGTTITSGVLQIGNGGTTGTLGGGNVVNSATLTFNRSNALSVSNNISGTGTVTKTGAGTTTLTGTNTYTEATTISAGSLSFAKTAALYNGTDASWSPAKISVESGATLAVGVGESGSGYFDSTAVDTLLNGSHLGASATTTGLKSGASIGFDTTNATAGAFTYGSAIANIHSGSLGVTKLGAGTLTLTGTNSYTGATTVNGGILKAGSSSSFGVSSAVVMGTDAGTTLDLNGCNTQIGKLSGGGAAGGTVAIGSATLTIGNGAIDLTGSNYAGALTGTGTISIAGNHTAGSSVNSQVNITSDNSGFSGAIKVSGARLIAGTQAAIGSGTIEVNSNGQFFASGITYTNNFVVSNTTGWLENATTGNQGAIRLSNSTTLSGTIQLKAATTIGITNNANVATISGNISEDGGSLSLTKAAGGTTSGSGTLILSGNNTYTGGTTIAGGILSVGTIADSGDSNIGNTGSVILSGGTLKYTAVGATTSTARAFTATAASSIEIADSGTTLTLKGAFGGPGNTIINTKKGAGTLEFTGANNNGQLAFSVAAGSLVLGKASAANTLCAVVNINDIAAGATVRLSGTGGDQIYANNASTSGLVNMSGGTLDLNSHSESIRLLTGTSGTVTNSAASTTSTLTVGQVATVAQAASFGGVIEDGSGSVALTKIGENTQILTGANTYTGATTVNSGTLLANTPVGSATGTGAVTVKATATLGGNGFISGAVSLESGATLAPGNAGIGPFGMGALTLVADATFSAQIDSSTPESPIADLVTVTANVDLGGSTLSLDDIAGTSAVINAGQKITLITYSGALSGTFNGLEEGATTTIEGNTFKIRYADGGAVTLEALVPVNGYSTWAGTNAPLQTAGQDFDHDGVSNGVEWVLGGLSSSNDSGKLPTVSTTGGNLLFSFLRNQASKTAGTSVSIDVGTTLATWSSTYIVGNDTAGSTAGVTVTDNLNGTDTVTLTIPQAPDAKKFARLNVVITP